MFGNVWEWVQDYFGDYPKTKVTDPYGADTGSGRVLRGGSWLSDARPLRSAYRHNFDPGDRRFHLGFRLARVKR